MWTASEKATLGLIADTADRVEVLKKLLAAEVKSIERCAPYGARSWPPRSAWRRPPSPRWSASLDPEMVVQAKSARHQAAAHTRWSGAGLGGPA